MNHKLREIYVEWINKNYSINIRYAMSELLLDLMNTRMNSHMDWLRNDKVKKNSVARMNKKWITP